MEKLGRILGTVLAVIFSVTAIIIAAIGAVALVKWAMRLVS